MPLDSIYITARREGRAYAVSVELTERLTRRWQAVPPAPNPHRPQAAKSSRMRQRTTQVQLWTLRRSRIVLEFDQAPSLRQLTARLAQVLPDVHGANLSELPGEPGEWASESAIW